VALRARRRQYAVRAILEQQAQAAQKRDEFFATLSHELRTPLNVILGWVELLRAGTLNESAREQAFEILERNAKTQKGLIDDLLDVSRIITGKLALESVSVSFADLLKSTVGGFLPRAREKDVSVQLTLGDGDFHLMGDEERLSQVVSNLVSNALKFTPRGGHVWLSLEKAGDNVTLVCRDDGEGVDPAFLPSIFDRLKQEDMSTTRSHGGLGLGLAICAHIVQEHGGQIRAFSEGKGKGLTVAVTLPGSVSKPLAPAPAMPEASVQDLRGLRVLVVDDSHDILDLVNFWLGRAGAKVHLAESAAQGLQALADFRPDVILSDIGMPAVDGYELITAIRRLPPEKGGAVPAAALTAYARDEERNLALKAGFQLHIPKPINSRDLITAVGVLAAHGA
jgi:CheY-like chemotaxis protein